MRGDHPGTVTKSLFMKPTLALELVCLVGACLLYCSWTSAQSEDLTQDTMFFRSQKDSFQLWLEYSGIGDKLRAEALKVDDGRISLCLSFACPCPDSAAQAWQGLKEGFDEKHYISLEQQLFYKLANMMEVWQSETCLQISGDYEGPERSPHFFRGIYFRDGKLVVEPSAENFPWVINSKDGPD